MSQTIIENVPVLSRPPGELAPRENPVGVDQETAVADLVAGIESGQIDPCSLNMFGRQSCVEQLSMDGMTNGEIARFLKVSERTVKRDLAAVRREAALEPSWLLGDELIGEMQRLTLAAVRRLTRMSGEPSLPPYARLWAQEAVVRTYDRFIGAAQRMKYIEPGEGRIRWQREMERRVRLEAARQAELEAQAAKARAKRERREQRLAAETAGQSEAPA